MNQSPGIYGKKAERTFHSVPTEQTKWKKELVNKTKAANEERKKIIVGGRYWPAVKELIEHVKKTSGEKIYRIDTFFAPELFKMLLVLYYCDEKAYAAFKKEYNLHLRITKNDKVFAFAPNLFERVLNMEKEIFFLQEAIEGAARGFLRAVKNNNVKLDGENPTIIELSSVKCTTRTGKPMNIEEENNFILWLIKIVRGQHIFFYECLEANTDMPIFVQMANDVFVIGHSIKDVSKAASAVMAN